MDRVSVGRMTVDCVVPRNHPNPLQVRTRLDETAAGPLQQALTELLAPLSKLGDEVIVIPRLELSFDLDISGTPSEVARRWAARLAAALAAYLRPDARTTMLRFPDEAHYLARFLIDAVVGRANAWYYRRYQGWAALPLAAKLGSALLEDHARGLLALRVLSAAELTSVLSALGAREARRVVDTVAAGADRDLGGVAAVLAPLVEAWLPLASSLSSPWSAALALLAHAAEALSPDELPRAARLAAALAAYCAQRPRASSERTPSRAEEIAAELDGAGLPNLGPLLALEAARREALLAPLGRPKEVPVPRAEWHTRFGGVLLLLARVGELPLHEVFGDEQDHACLRLLLLARASGRPQVLADPLFRRICGVPDELDLDEWLAAQAPRIEAALPVALWRRSFARASRLRLEVTRHPQWGSLQVLIGEPDGDWLALAPLAPLSRALLRGPAWEGVAFRPALAPARAARRVLAHVVLGSSPAELALALAAQQVLRAFARRLPGFSESSPRHLYDNFLDFDATAVENDGVFHCRVGRPRLAAIFGLTGALRGRIPLGFGGLSLELYPA